MAIVLAFGAALSNALTTIFQRMGVQSAPAGSAMRWRLIAHILRRPVWFLGFATMIGGFALQALALGRGGLSVVQPIMVAELVFVVVILRVWFHRTLGIREAVGTGLTVLGLSGFLAVSDQSLGSSIPSTADWRVSIALCAGAIVVACVLARRGSRPWRSAAFGFGAAVAFALCAAFTKTATILYSGGFLQLFGHFETYGIAVSGLIGLFLAQNAFYSGPITASQATLTIVDPIVSITLGIAMFGDHLRDSPGDIAVETLALIGMVVGLFVLCHSPLIVGATTHERLTRHTPTSQGRPDPGAEPVAGRRSPTPSA